VQLFIAPTIAPSQLHEACIGVVREIRARRKSGTQLRELGGFLRRPALSGEAGDDTFRGAKYFKKVGHLGRDRANNPAAHLRQDFQQALDGQAADCVAHRRAAYREYPPDRFGRDLIAWVEAAAQQETLEIGVGEVVQPRAAAPQFLDGVR